MLYKMSLLAYLSLLVLSLSISQTTASFFDEKVVETTIKIEKIEDDSSDLDEGNEPANAESRPVKEKVKSNDESGTTKEETTNNDEIKSTKEVKDDEQIEEDGKEFDRDLKSSDQDRKLDEQPKGNGREKEES